MQNSYWNYMQQIRFDIFYLELYVERSYRMDKGIKIFCAVASSASIAAWALWQQHSFLWAVIIAALQVITAINEFLPYSKRLKYLAPFIKDLSLLYNDMECSWHNVASGNMTEEEINELLYGFKNKYIKLENDSLKKEALPEHKKFIKTASQKTEEYFAWFLSAMSPEKNRKE